MAESRAWALFVVVNVTATLVTIAVSVVVMVHPGFAVPEGGPETFALATGLRSLAVAAVLLWCLIRRDRQGLVVLLAVSGLIQLGDGLIHLLNGSPAAVAAAILAVTALLSGRWLVKTPVDPGAQRAESLPELGRGRVRQSHGTATRRRHPHGRARS